MRMSITMALRNLRRRPTRSLLTLAMIVVGTSLSVWMMGTANGSYDLMIDGTTRGWMGHFQVLSGDYAEKPSLYKNIDNPAPLVESMTKTAGVQGVTTRIETGGLLALDNRTVATAVLGVDPVNEASTTTLPENVSDGEWLATKPLEETAEYPMVIGRGIANRLEARVGDILTFVGQAADGSMAADLFSVVGIYDSGSRRADRALVFVRITDAQELLVLGSRVHRIVGTVNDSRALASVMSKLPRPASAEHRLSDWMELNPELWDLIKADRDSSAMILWAVILVVVLGVANTMAMSVFERTRELGVMLALGTSPGRVVSVVLWEVSWLSVVGVGIGIAFGAVCVEYTSIPLPEPVEMGGVVFTHMTGSNTWQWTLFNPMLVIAASLLSGLFPARQAAGLRPVDAIAGRRR